MIKKTFSSLTVLFLILGFFVVCALPVCALLAPQVYFTEITLNKSNIDPGETVSGAVFLWNYEQTVIGDLVLNFQLLGDKVDGVSTKMIDSQTDNDIFQLFPDEKTEKSFSYSLPSNLPSGSFVFRVQLVNSRGEEMSWIDKAIIVGGENKFLTLDNYWLVKDGLNMSPGAGVDYQSGEIPQIIFNASNDSDFTITAFPKITTYKRNIGQFLREDKGKNIVLEPRQKQDISAILPQLTNPESYLSEVRLYDAEDEELVSNSIYFRWVISGHDGAEILFVNSDKDYYEKGEEAEMNVQLTGPPHAYLENTSYEEDVSHDNVIKQGILKISLFNQNDKLVGQGTREIDLDSGQVSVVFAVSENVVNPKIKTRIIKNGETLDSYEFEVKSKNTPLGSAVEEKVGFLEKNKKLLFFIFIGLILIIIIMFYFKRRRLLMGVLVVFVLSGAGISFTADNALAAVEVDGGYCDTTIIFNSPLPNQTYKDGDVINFSGKFRVTSCGDGLFFNKISFFITEDKEIPLVPVNACSDCLGGSSSSYGDCNIGWCNQVKILDTNAGYKIRKLGEIYPSDVHSGARPYWVSYNQDFAIPNDLEFSGPVRFYVQYSGTHWHSHWHWNVTYQPGIVNINKSPTVSNLTVSAGDSTTYCGTVASHHFSWTYSDPDGDNEERFQFQIDNNGNFSSPEVSCDYDGLSYPSPTTNSQTVAVLPSLVQDQLSYNTTYYWRVNLWDSEGNDSGWTSGPYFTTKKHRYPSVDFNWFPQEPSEGEDILFADQSIVYGEASELSRSWTFKNSNPSSSAEQNPIIQFNSDGPQEVVLTVTDSDGYTCSKSKTVNVQWNLPGWEEILHW